MESDDPGSRARDVGKEPLDPTGSDEGARTHQAPGRAGSSCALAGTADKALAELGKGKEIMAGKKQDERIYLVSLAAAAFGSLAAAGEDVRVRAQRLHGLATRLDAYPMDAKARLLALVAKQARYRDMRARLVGDILAAVHETASSATVVTRFVEAERPLLVSSTKTRTRWDFVNLRDNRNEAYSMSLVEGWHALSTTVRATTPGVFIATPAKAEEMYSPETFGRSTGALVEIVGP